MTDAKHTPGPWTVNRNGNVVDRHKMRVATPDGADIEQMEANAHLIAAGPELLEALEFTVQFGLALIEMQAGDKWMLQAIAADVERARAVIAKARGEA